MIHNNLISTYIGIVVFLLICTTLSSPALGSELCSGAFFPSSLDPFFAAGELQLSSQYVFDSSIGPTVTTFKLDKESLVRGAVGPHHASFNVALTVLDANSGSVVLNADSRAADMTQIYGLLSAGSYKLQVKFSRREGSMGVDINCIPAHISIAIAAKDVVASRASAFASSCPSATTIPSIDFSPLASNQAIHYSSDADIAKGTVFAVVPSASTSAVDQFPQKYVFTVPSGSSSAIFRAILSSEAISSGFVRVVLQSNVTTNPTKPNDLPQCIERGDCRISTSVRKNQQALLASLSAGTYALWFVYTENQVPAPVDSLAKCAPFAFDLDIAPKQTEEDIVICGDASPLPASMDDVEGDSSFFSDHGYLYVKRDFLLQAGQSLRSTKITVKTESFIRIRVDGHKNDLDILLSTNEGGNEHTVAYSGRDMGPEVIAVRVQEGVYDLSITTFGVSTTSSCDTFTMEMEVAPVEISAYAESMCKSASSSLPDITGLANLANTKSYSFRDNTKTFVYKFDNDADLSQKLITAQDFTIKEPMRAIIRVSSQFLFGDVGFTLVSASNPLVVIHPTTHERNEYVFDELLPADTYTLNIVTGFVQQLFIPKASTFCSCAKFQLSINIAAPSAQSESDRLCGKAPMLPNSLNIPGYLETSDLVHVYRQLRSPDIYDYSTSYVSQTTFTLRSASLLRVNIPSNHLDIDAILYMDTVVIATSSHMSGDEDISVELQPNFEYTLQLRFYHWEDERREEDICFIYDFELSITPLSLGGSICPSENLPGLDFMPAVLDPPAGTGYFKSGKFWFHRYSPSSVPSSKGFSFQVKSLTLFRAILHFDAVYGPLKLSVATRGASGSERVAILSYNTRDTGDLLLAPGNYSMVISEYVSPAQLPSSMKSACIPFYFEIGARLSSDDTSKSGGSSDLTCRIDGSSLASQPLLLPLTSTLNKPGFIHPLSGNAVYMSNKYLADTTSRSSFIEFSVQEPTLYKVYLPMQEDSVDVDIWLRSGTKASPGSIINYMNDVRDEAMTGKIASGQYVFELRYFNLDANEQCVSFGMELALLPVSALAARPEVGTLCSNEYPPEKAELDKDVSTSFKFSPASFTKYNANSEFSIESGKIGYLRAEVVGDFLTGGVILSVQGRIQMGMLDIDKTYYAMADTDRTSLNVVLWPGNYTMRIRDLTQLTAPSELQCASYSLTYHIISDSDIDPGKCMEVESIPTDTYTQAGGSEVYGGLQLSDGSVFVSGDHFFLSSEESKRSQWTSFRLYGESFTRFSVKVADPDDVDLYLYGNRSDTSSLIGSVLGTDDFDSGLFLIQPEHATAASPQTYDLKTYIYRYDESQRCRYFRWALGVIPAEHLHDLIKCPENLPEEHNRVPPESIVVDKHVSVFSNNYVFTRTFIQQHSVLDFFRYRVRVDVKKPSQLYAALQYNYFSDDYRFKLRNYDDGKVLASGAVSSASRVTTNKNMRSVISTLLQPGTYSLDIEQDLLVPNAYSYLELEVPYYCSLFSFDFSATPVGSDVPSITSVSPQVLTDYEPCQNLVLTITFSKTVDNVPTDSDKLVAWLASNIAVVLNQVNGSSSVTVPLNKAVIDPDLTHIQLVYSKDSLTFAKSYVLSVRAEAFAHAGTAFKNDDTVQHVYNTTACDCSGHGTCQSPGPHGECMYCACRDHWVGPTCSSCEDGFHPSDNVCQQNELCGPDACSGHGTCDNTTGARVCVCDVGYASSENAMCDKCASGFTGYPNCVPDGSETVPCVAPLLPTTLNTVSHLGWKGYTVLSGEYYIDTRTMYHDMKFTLEEDSIFRVYVEDHRLDIDLRLYRLNGDGSLGEMLVHRSNFGGEESAFIVLDGVKGVGRPYLLKLQYYAFGVTVGSCETFELELEIMRYGHLAEFSDKWFESTIHLNNSVLPSISDHTIKQDFHYQPDTIFAVLDDPHVKTAPNYFWNYRFTVEAMEDHMPLLRTRVNSRFAFGQVALKLEEGDQADHCASENSYTSLDQSRCMAGDSTMNGNYIEKVIQPGKYVLWLYEPLLQNNSMTPAARFDFAFNIDYVPSSNAYWECNMPELPAYLNSDGYIHKDGTMHLRDLFHSSGESTTSFATTEESVFRAASNNGVLFTLVDSASKTTLVSGAKNVLKVLPVGHYSLTMRALSSSHPKCLTLDMELALEPTSSIASQTCSETRLPVIEVGSLPYHLGPSETEPHQSLQFFATPYSSGNTLVAQYSFHLTELAFLSVDVSSNFLYHDLGIELLDAKTGSTITVSDHKMNMQSVQQRLSGGDYTLRLVTPSVDGSRPSALPTCLPFNMVMDIISDNDPSTDTGCLLDGEAIPVTFDDERFLNAHGTMEFGSTSLRIPSKSSLKSVIPIPFSTVRKSFMRVFVDSNSAVDIDICVKDTETEKIIAEGSSGLFGLETFVANLPVGNYALVLTFWIWDKKLLPDCPTFSMQVSITDSSELSQDKQCPTSDDKWPPQIGDVRISQKLNYSYDSLTAGDDLYFRQTDSEVAMWKSDFTVDAVANVAVDVSYDFERSDLVVFLMRMNGEEVIDTFYATTYLHHCFLMLHDISPGSYRLTMYDPLYLDSSVRGCAHFTFSVKIEEPSTLFTNDHATVPSSLNGVPYLAFDGSTDIFDTFVMFRFSDTESTTFTVSSESTIRAEAQYELSSARSRDVRLVLHSAKSGTRDDVIADYSTTLYAHLQPGRYRLEFIQVNGSGSSITGEGEMIQTSISLHTVAELKSILDSAPVPATCEDVLVPSIVPTPDGYYQYTSTDRQVSQKTLNDARKNGAPIQKLSVTLNQQSVLWAEIGVDFAMNALDLVLTRHDGEVLYTTMYRNSHTVRAVLPAGQHTLEIFAPAPFKDNDMELLPRCTLFTFAMTLSPDDASSRCAFLDLVPWDLNRYDGGSLPFGGPMDENGFLSIYGDSFGVPPQHNTDTLSVTIREDSVVSVIVGAGTRMSSVGVSLVEVATGTELTPLTSSQTHGMMQRAILWKVEPSVTKHTAYEIVLTYSGLCGSCSSFEMQIKIEPVTLLQSSLVCPITGEKQDLPETVLDIDPRGYASDYHDSWFFSSDALVTQGVNEPYDITFVVRSVSVFSVSFSFNSLVNMLDLDLMRRGDDGNYLTYAHSTLKIQRSMTGLTTVTRSIVKTLTSGTYIMRLTSSSFSNPIALDKTVFCMPFTYIVQLMPLDGTPYVSDVTPALARGLSPSKPLTLLLRFSESVYDVETSDRADASAIKDVFELAKIKKNDRPAHPTSVTPASTDATLWALNFNSSLFDSLTTYRLQFTGGERLADDEGQNVSYTLVNIYSTLDATCSGHGSLDSTSGKCICEEAYAGENCNSCNLGYMRVQGSDPDSVRCVPAVKCEENTCGCNNSIGKCNPLGTCYIDREDGRARCHCNDGYSGAYCRECSAGYVGWPNCVRCLNNGTWDEESSKCICPRNFKGDVCGECAFGYSGDDCSANAAIPVLVLLSIVFVAALAVAGVIVYNKYFKPKGPAPYELLPTTGDDDDIDPKKSNGVIDSNREKLDFGEEIDGDDDILADAGSSDVVGMNLDPEKMETDKSEKNESKTQQKSQTVVDLLNSDEPIDDNDDDFFAYKKL